MKKTPSLKAKSAYTLLFALFFIPQIMQAQKLEWVSLANAIKGSAPLSYSPIYPPALCLDANNNSYIAGNCRAGLSFSPNISTDSGGFLASYDRNGKAKWAISAKGGCVFQNIVTSGNDDIVVLGIAEGTASYDGFTIDSGVYFIMKADTNGKVKWLKEFGYTDSFQIGPISEKADGKTYFSGSFYNSNGIYLSNKLVKGPFPGNNFIACLDSSGNITWANILASYNGNGLNYATSTSFMNNSGASYQLNSFSNYSNETDTVMVNSKIYTIHKRDSGFYIPPVFLNLLEKLNPDGSLAWSKIIRLAGNNNNNNTREMTVGPQGEIFVITDISSDSLFGSNSQINDSIVSQEYFIKLDSSGNMKSAYVFLGDSIYPNFYTFTTDNKDYVYLVYEYYSNTTYSDEYRINQYDNSGILKWSKAIFHIRGQVDAYMNYVAPGYNNNLGMIGMMDTTKNIFFDSSVTCSYYSIFTGMFSLDDETGISKAEYVQGPFFLYPNPATQNISLKYAANIPGEYNCTITDLTGREVQSTEIQAIAGENINQINIQNLSAGMYIVSLQGNNFVQRVKFLKE